MLNYNVDKNLKYQFIIIKWKNELNNMTLCDVDGWTLSRIEHHPIQCEV